MKIDLDTADNLFLDYGEGLTEVLRRAARQALLNHKLADIPSRPGTGRRS
jgi:hypothetical protein